MSKINSYILLDNEHEIDATTENISLGELEKSDFKDFFVNRIKNLLKDINEEEKCNEGMTISRKIIGRYIESYNIDVIINMYGGWI